jgi:hypothetical protein
MYAGILLVQSTKYNATTTKTTNTSYDGSKVQCTRILRMSQNLQIGLRLVPLRDTRPPHQECHVVVIM